MFSKMIKLNQTSFVEIIQKVENIYNKLELKEQEKTKGRNLAISIPEILALSIYKQSYNIKTKKALFNIFKPACSYKTLVVNMNRFAVIALVIIWIIMFANRQNSHQVKITDSTDIPVCSNRKANNHKTMALISDWDNTGKGYFYGLKLHFTIDVNHKLLAFAFCNASMDEREVFLTMNKSLLGIFLADAGYISAKLSKAFNIDYLRILLAKPRVNMKKMATKIQGLLYNLRGKIEFDNRNLKMFYGLITSLPRSMSGYFANYIYSLLAYLIA